MLSAGTNPHALATCYQWPCTIVIVRVLVPALTCMWDEWAVRCTSPACMWDPCADRCTSPEMRVPSDVPALPLCEMCVRTDVPALRCVCLPMYQPWPVCERTLCVPSDVPALRWVCCCGQPWVWHMFWKRDCDGLCGLLTINGFGWNTIVVSIVNLGLCQTHCKQVLDFSRPSGSDLITWAGFGQ